MRAWRALIGKEVRAIALPFAGAAVVMIAAAFVPGVAPLDAAAFITYAIAPVALGALVIGHDFTHHTLAAQLTLPVTRRQLLLAKTVVLMAALTALGISAYWAMATRIWHPGYGRGLDPHQDGLALLWLPLACGLFLAPLFTLLSKSTLGGLVLAAAVPAWMWLIGEFIGLAQVGIVPTDHPLLMAVKFDWLRLGVAASCAVAALAFLPIFERLEVGGAANLTGETLRARRSPESAGLWITPRRCSVWWLLVAKETRLQKMAFVVAGLYVILALALSNLPDHAINFRNSAAALAPLFVWFTAALVGAQASAEERQLGTLEWQSLLPVAAWKQWAVKVGVALVLLVALGVGLPFVLTEALAPERAGHGWSREMPAMLGVGASLFVGSLYVSTLNTSGIRALIYSFPSMVLGGLAFGAATLIVGRPLRRLGGWIVPAGFTIGADEFETLRRVAGLVALVAIAGFLLFVIRLAMKNHGSAERGGVLLRRQIGWLATSALAGVLAWSVIDGALSALWVDLVRRRSGG